MQKQCKTQIKFLTYETSYQFYGIIKLLQKKRGYYTPITVNKRESTSSLTGPQCVYNEIKTFELQLNNIFTKKIIFKIKV